MAGELGFEPRLNDPESFVLPLHYSPVDVAARIDKESIVKFSTDII